MSLPWESNRHLPIHQGSQEGDRAMKRLGWIAVIILTAVLAVVGATAQGAPASSSATPRAETASAGNMSVKFNVKRFTRSQNRLIAQGEAVATFVPSDGSAPTTVRRNFTARVVVG